ncbi:MAG: threonylcarbamoyl-AMP synthase [Gemmatimonadetes bacterium]|nr:threonylcarbamoyl-AMP synthase [Gemmatimonadota bacterium]NNL31164.1 threonylcarbamoyl-AMP synthase [Gemmatimonadota bacterium]
MKPDLTLAVEHLQAGGLLAYPTETVYGLGGPCTPEAVDAVRRLKGRAEGKPLLALVPSADGASGLVWTDEARELAGLFWPGSVTLVLDDPQGTFPAGVRSARGTVGVRVSPHPLVAALLAGYGRPLTSTSLNAPGEAPVSSGGEARELLGRLGADGVLLLDVGTLPESAPSTVVDCSGPTPVVLREGAIPTDRLRCVIPEIHGTRID